MVASLERATLALGPEAVPAHRHMTIISIVVAISTPLALEAQIRAIPVDREVTAAAVDPVIEAPAHALPTVDAALLPPTVEEPAPTRELLPPLASAIGLLDIVARIQALAISPLAIAAPASTDVNWCDLIFDLTDTQPIV